MKRQLIVIAMALVGFMSAQAQGGFQRRTPEERLKPIHEKLDSAFKLDAAKLTQADNIFLDAFKEQDKQMEELRAGGAQPDRDAMMAIRKKVVEARDEKLKAILTEEQMKTWKEQIEPTLRPQRQPRQ
jgi:periplasmic protein CpxP/Spy